MSKQTPTLIVFGCGYVGTEVARQALARGWEVRALVRNEESIPALLELGCAQVEAAEVSSDDWHDKFDPHQDFVLNCVSSAGGGLEGYRRSYVEGQRSILKWASAGHIGTYVYTSATSVYPQSDGGWVDEEASNEGASDNGQILLESEQLLVGASGLSRWFVLRLSGIYGPGRHFLVDMLRGGRTEFSGFGEAWLNLNHRTDIVNAVYATFEAPAQFANRIYNVADGNPATRAEIIGWLAQQCGCPAPSFEASKPGVRDSGRRTASGRLPNRRISTERIRQELGWSPEYDNYVTGFAELLH